MLRSKTKPQCSWCTAESICDLHGESTSLDVIYPQCPEDVILNYTWFNQCRFVAKITSKDYRDWGGSKGLEMRVKVFSEVSMGIRLLIHCWMTILNSNYVLQGSGRRRERATELYATNGIKTDIKKHGIWPQYSQSLLKETKHMQIHKDKESYGQNKE